MRRLWGIVLAALLCLTAAAALSESGIEIETWTPSRGNFRKGSTWTVYAGPGYNFGRAGGGKARVSTSGRIDVYGQTNGGWLLVEYEISGGKKRVGWLSPDDAKADPPWLDMTGVRCVCLENTNATDDPHGKKGAIGVVRRGETVMALGRVDGWIYAAWGAPDWQLGFVRESTLANDPGWHIEGTTLVVEEGVTSLGLGEPGEDDTVTWSATNVMLTDMYSYNIESLRLPGSLRTLHSESIIYGSLREIVLPEGLETVEQDAFYGISIGRIVLPSTLTSISNQQEYVTIGAWEAAENNPVYRTVEGVLFSRDGTTLVDYPNGKQDTHYDVPRGTRVIGRFAMENEFLTTVSLPIGLQELGEGAFAGCTRLHSLAVPMTVKKIGDGAFYSCVSLENLSLPEGLTATRDTWAVYYGPDDPYHGDNGGARILSYEESLKQWQKENASNREDTYSGGEAAGFSVWGLYAIVDAETDVPVYGDAALTRKTGTLPPGTQLALDWMLPDACRYVIQSWPLESGYIRKADLQLMYAEELFSYGLSRVDAGVRTWENSEILKPSPTGVMPQTITGESHGAAGAYWNIYLRREDTTALHVWLPDMQLTRKAGAGVFAVVAPDGPGTPVPLRESPSADSAASVRLWGGRQAQVLETADGWCRVRTALGEGWVPEKDLQIVSEE